MYSLPTPIATAADAYNAAVRTIKNTNQRATYARAAPIIQARCDAFDQLGAELKFDDADVKNFKVPGLDLYTMAELYDKQFTNNGGTKAIRDSIKNAARINLCPYCGVGSVAQLDHYLPKTKFAGTAVHPANLVPACGDCNFAKLDYVPGVQAPAVLHPYFDTAFDMTWLSANLKRSELGPPTMQFTVRLVQSDPGLEARLNAHMNIFKLRQRFSVWAAQSLNDFERSLQSEHTPTMTLHHARDYLRHAAVHASGGRVNSWQGAAYKAMLDSDWYLTKYLNLD